MKNITVLLLLFFASFYNAQVKWMTLEEAIEAQKENPKKILIDFYADWCGPCKIMDKNTYGNPIISELINKNYYAVKFNAEGRSSVTVFGRTFVGSEGKKKGGMHEFTKFMNVNAVPSLVFLDEQSMPITILQGALTARELEPYIPFIAKDEYKKVNSREEWETYQKKFKYTIKD